MAEFKMEIRSATPVSAAPGGLAERAGPTARMVWGLASSKGARGRPGEVAAWEGVREGCGFCTLLGIGGGGSRRVAVAIPGGRLTRKGIATAANALLDRLAAEGLLVERPTAQQIEEAIR